METQRTTSGASYQERDRLWSQFLAHPQTIDDTVRVGLFPSKQTASRRKKKLEQRSGFKPRCIATVQMHRTGRKTEIFYNGEHVIQHPKHEAIVTQCLTEMLGVEFFNMQINRDLVRDGKESPDATIAGEMDIDLEIDLATEGLSQVQKKMRWYDDFESPVIWYTTSETRIRNMMSFATENAWFSVIGSGVLINEVGQQVASRDFLQAHKSTYGRGCDTPLGAI